MVDRVYERNASGSVPDAPVDPSIGYPTNGNPSQGVPATMPGEYWYYMITESLRKVIVDAGLVPDHLDMGLFSDAIQQAFTNRLADSVEAQDHLNGTLALSPASLIAGVLGAGSAAASGYIPIPYRDAVTGEMKRLIIQFGAASTVDSVVDANFPIAFPNAAFRVVATHGSNAGVVAVAVGTLTNTYVRMSMAPPSEGTINFIAIGN